MPIINQQSSILSEQELQLLSSHENQHNHTAFIVYSYQYKISLAGCKLILSHTIESLNLMLTAAPRGVAVILPREIESEPDFHQLVTLLTRRADICIFWLGQLPSMETNLLAFTHCINKSDLITNVTSWQNYVNLTFNDWLKKYPVVFITENEGKKIAHQNALSSIGLQQVKYLNVASALTDINEEKLLIIDLNNDELRLIELLNNLSQKQSFPIIIIYGQLPANVCRATYTLIENHGFSILASLKAIPDEGQWNKLFLSLFSKVYLKHWVVEDKMKMGAYPLYDLETQEISSYFCLYGMTKMQIASLEKPNNMRHIINVRSVKDWFPEGIKREMRGQLATDLNCDIYNIDLCIEHPEKILRTSLIFSTLVMASLSKARIYWLVENENDLFSDILKNFPISDIILSEKLSHQLLTEPTETVLEFLQQAQRQQIKIIASLQHTRTTSEALALYGIELVLNKHHYIEQTASSSF